MFKTTATLSTLAIGISIISLLVSIGAYNRTAYQVQQTTNNRNAVPKNSTNDIDTSDVEGASTETSVSIESIDRQAKEIELLAILRLIKTDIEEENITNETFTNINEAKDQAQKAYDEDEDDLRVWQEDLDKLEDLLTNNNEEALKLTSNLIIKLETK